MNQTKLMWLLGGTALVISAGLNLFLIRRAVRDYRTELELRLDPARQGVLEPLAPPVASRPGVQRVVLLGDSRIEMWAHPPEMAGVDYVNFGRGGETSAQLLLRHEALLTWQPAAVLLEVGVNDLKAIGLFPERAEAIVANCIANLDRIVGSLTGHGVRVAVATVFPIRKFELYKRFAYSEGINAGIRRVNDHIRSLAAPAATPAVVVVDCDPVLLDGSYLRAEYAANSLHMNDAGYLAIADRVKGALDACLGAARDGRK
jgi:lysophospholipase L1-like esterase